MLDDFFVRAVVAGICIAVIAGPLGCVVVWRRLSYFGDTLSHASLLGVCLSFLLQVNLTFAVFGVAMLVALLLIFLLKRGDLPSDAMLALLSHSSLAIGLVVIAVLGNIRVDLTSLLIGDILSVSKLDIGIIAIGGVFVLGTLAFVWRELFIATVDQELAKAEGYNPGRSNLIFVVLMAIVIAISIKIIGVLLITALLIIPAATARRFASTPEQMMLFASLLGVLAVLGGLFGSVEWDTPSGPSIVVAAVLLFVVSLLPVFSSVRKGTRGT